MPAEFLAQALDYITGPPTHPHAPGVGAPGRDIPAPSTPRPGAPLVPAPRIPVSPTPPPAPPVSPTVPAQFTPDRRGLGEAVRAAATAALASATPSRHDRLFPGDIQQFANPAGGLSLGYGAAGVLYALSQTGERVCDHEMWLAAHATWPRRGASIGLYDGLLGVAFVLHHLGDSQAALKTAELCLAEDWHHLGSSLHGGLAGVALVLAHLGEALAEPGLGDAGEQALDIVASRGAVHAGSRRSGLMHGASGPALLFVRWFERTGDPAYLDLAADALHSDLDQCVTSHTGALQVDEGCRVVSCLGQGSVGIGLVMDEYLRHRHDERMACAVAGIRLAARSHFYVQSGLFNGRAGMILYLARLGRVTGADKARLGAADPDLADPDLADPDLAGHIRRLAWHAVSYGGGTAFPGDGLYRLSMDLATGTAGILLSLAVAADPHLPGLPFLSRATARTQEDKELDRNNRPAVARDRAIPGHSHSTPMVSPCSQWAVTLHGCVPMVTQWVGGVWWRHWRPGFSKDVRFRANRPDKGADHRIRPSNAGPAALA
ncbi:MAG TPA: lanthionine synthetase LanC family protein [Streptosporangiaceae bacterium]|nr:lanthionine synthetase LanC family protein [Streptosporangiaceae bacterium]